MKKNPSALLFFFVCLTFLAACSNDDEDDVAKDILEDIEDNLSQNGIASITATINGNEFSASGVFVTSVLSPLGNGSYNLAIGGARINDGVNYALVLGIISSDFSSLSEGDTFVGDDSEKLMIGYYTLDDNNTVDFKAETEMAETNILTITKIDREAKLISGTFSYDAIDEDTKNVYEVRDGEFTDVQYDDKEL
ncbi:hypothetical protein OKW21_003949 [Catalinimonas alkaloidigena]|uniref:hypothetical protein n=1 Tax=Catalinimonas alkaloidigena TaxID=1075417 RepID=UPI00240677E0|nr:hypothetical protein [Catalinimonas alkaloidigena]MDF9798686.1 hypothetical protein [Catalinimonas alkaloidigena]